MAKTEIKKIVVNHEKEIVLNENKKYEERRY